MSLANLCANAIVTYNYNLSSAQNSFTHSVHYGLAYKPSAVANEYYVEPPPAGKVAVIKIEKLSGSLSTTASSGTFRVQVGGPVGEWHPVSDSFSVVSYSSKLLRVEAYAKPGTYGAGALGRVYYYQTTYSFQVKYRISVTYKEPDPPPPDFTIKDGTIVAASLNYCSMHKDDLVLPSARAIGEYVFSNYYISKVTIPSSVIEIGHGAFFDCDPLSTVVLSEGLVSIGESAFKWTGIRSIKLPSTVTTIGNDAFQGNANLTDVSLPRGLKQMGWSVFSHCTKLTSLKIPASVTKIGPLILDKCPSLRSIYFQGNAPTIEAYNGHSLFKELPSPECCVYVKRGTTGWGVDIPGTWLDGVRIDYYDGDDDECAFKIAIRFNSGGGTGSMKTIQQTIDICDDGSSYILPECEFSKDGYEFAGWDMEEACTAFVGAPVYQPGYGWPLCGDLTLTATWKKIEEKHVMTLYRNNSSGDGAGAKRTVTEGAYYTLPTISSLGWTRSGYTFKGWATYQGATSATYGDGARIYVSSSLYSLYAVWQSNASKHVMTLYRNNSSGDGAGARRTVTDNAYYTLPTIASLGWTRNGYTFKGWATSRGATSATYGDGARIYISSSLHSLYGVWQPNAPATYTLRLHRNNSNNDGATAGRTMTINASRNLPTISELKWTRSGYTFLGWAKSSTATSATYSNGQSVKNLSMSKGSTVHLYAVWKKNAPATYTLRLHRNNSANDGATAGRTLTVNASRTLPTISELGWARSGYTFLGWSSSSSATSATYSNGQSVKNLTTTKGATVHLYAVWKKNAPVTYTLRLHRNNSANDGATAGRTLTVNVSRKLPTLAELKWTRSGYTFRGWALGATASNAVYFDGQSVKNLSTVKGSMVHLYAVWESNVQTYKICLCRNNSANDGATAIRTMTIGKSRKLPTIAELGWARRGYRFAGWEGYSESTGNLVRYLDGQTVFNVTTRPNAILYFYAAWR